MSYIRTITPYALAFSLSFGACSLCSASDITPKSASLILEIDASKLMKFSLTEKKKHTFEKTVSVKHDSKISKSIKRAKRALNKLTSFKYGKKQKVKAHLSKSSYLLQYTHKL